MPDRTVIAFIGAELVAEGDLPTVARALKGAEPSAARAPLVFDAVTSHPVEVDLRGSVAAVVARAKAAEEAALAAAAEPESDEGEPRGPGRPRLGVIGREVTLLRRHWDWLAEQPGGASAALRRLVDQARAANADRDRLRRAQESAYRFMSATLGDQPGFEEAMRAFFGNDRARFLALTKPWPRDLREHARALAKAAFSSATPAPPSDA